MAPRIHIYDASGNEINDPERGVEYATGLQWSSLAPKGHASCSFRVTHDIAAQWLAADAFKVIIMDGNNIRYSGRLKSPNYRIDGGIETVTFGADGFYSVLAERKMRRRWVDDDAVKRLIWANYQTTTTGNHELPWEKSDGFILFRGGFGDVSRTGSTGLQLKYAMPTGTIINDFSYAVTFKSGEGFSVYAYNVDQAVLEDLYPGGAGDGLTYLNVATTSDTLDFTLAQGDTTSLIFYLYWTATDIYDQGDWIKMRDLVIRSVMNSFPSPNWYANEVIQDVLEIGASDAISSNYDGLESPTLAIIPFMTADDGYETLDDICTRLAQFGDSSNNTWYFYVWDETGASDGLPRAYLTQYSTSDFEYRARLADFISFESELDKSQIANSIIVRYTDAQGVVRYLTEDTNATLIDQDSIDTYNVKRHLEVGAGQCDSATALELGEQWLAAKSTPPNRGQFEIRGRIRNKYGIGVPVTQMRAGERVYIEDWNGGETWFLREVRITADPPTAICIRDLPPKAMEAELARQKAGLV